MNIKIRFITNLMLIVLLAGIANSFFVSCKRRDTANIVEAMMPKAITVRNNKFVDNHGRQVILNGINVVNKSKEQGYLISEDSTLYSKLRSWGFNTIRFGIIWAGLEPEPGVYNEEYLKEIDQHIRWAADNDIFVVLDMHQDLYSVLYGSGAPRWATLHESKYHKTGDVWSDTYFMSEAVQTSFDNFWTNALASDSIGLQDHYAQLWQHIAKRYANNPTVIGYDLMNEPFAGSSALQAIPTFFTAYGKMIYDTTGKELSRQELELMWSNIEERNKALEDLSTAQSFASVVDVLFPLNREFEAHKLQPFYQKVSDAIREVDRSTSFFLEHSYLSNIGVRSSIARTTLVDGSHDSLLVYAPHGYDLVRDIKDASDASPERINFIYNRIEETAQRLNMPTWLGEWGAFYRHGENIVPIAQHTVKQIENHLFGNAYWSYESKMDNLPYFKQALLRPYPAYTNGELVAYGYDRANKTFTMTWQEDKTNDAPSLVFVPTIASEAIKTISKSLDATIVSIPNSSAGWLVVAPLMSGEKRKLTIRL